MNIRVSVKFSQSAVRSQSKYFVSFKLKLYDEKGKDELKIQNVIFEKFEKGLGIDFKVTLSKIGEITLRISLNIVNPDGIFPIIINDPYNSNNNNNNNTGITSNTLSSDTTGNNISNNNSNSNNNSSNSNNNNNGNNNPKVINPLFGVSNSVLKQAASQTLQNFAGRANRSFRPIDTHRSFCNACTLHTPCPRSKYRDVLLLPESNELLFYIRVMAPANLMTLGDKMPTQSPRSHNVIHSGMMDHDFFEEVSNNYHFVITAIKDTKLSQFISSPVFVCGELNTLSFGLFF
jgi:hypothetical protein